MERVSERLKKGGRDDATICSRKETAEARQKYVHKGTNYPGCGWLTCVLVRLVSWVLTVAVAIIVIILAATESKKINNSIATERRQRNITR